MRTSLRNESDRAVSCTLHIATGADSLKILGTRYSAVSLRKRMEEHLESCDALNVGPLILRMGPAVLQRLVFSGCGEDTQAILKLVFASRIKDFSSRQAVRLA